MIRQILWFIGLCTLFGLFTQTSLAEESVDHNIAKVEHFFVLDKESLPHNEVIALSLIIIQQRQSYSPNIIAKVFIILADVAINEGNMARALQFATDGQLISGIDENLQLNLMLKVAAGYYAQEKFSQVRNIAEQTIKLAEKIEHIEYLLIAQSYKAMVHVVTGENHNADAVLQLIESLLRQHPSFIDHIELLENIAAIYSLRGDEQTAIIMYNKLIKLRFKLSKLNNIDQTYYYLAETYRKLEQFDDAYNAYWEAKKYAEHKHSVINTAYAKLGLGETLFQQRQYSKAYQLLQQAEPIFKAQSLTKPYLTTLIALTKTALLVDDTNVYRWLKKAEILAENTELTSDHLEMYLLLARMYKNQHEFEQALVAQDKYLEIFKSVNTRPTNRGVEVNLEKSDNEESRHLAVTLAVQNDLKRNFVNKISTQKQLIILLIIAVIALGFVIVFILIKQRTLRQSKVYDDSEKQEHFLTLPQQTKKIYQLSYKKARKYEYPLAIGYMSIENWKELTFHFNKKMVAEVLSTLESLFIENIGEFDHAGIISDGEYLLLCPHQTSQELKVKLNKLTDALKVRFFANLGEFSVKISYAFGTPNVQDIDPYIFLSRLSESTHR